MTLGTTWSEGVDLIRRDLYALLTIGAIVFLPIDFVAALIDDTRGWGDTAWWRILAATLVVLVGWSLAYAAAIAAVAVEPEGANEEPRTPFASLGDAFARIGTLLLVTILVVVGVAVGLVLLIVPGLVLLTWWSVAYQVAMVESGDWRNALGRSRELVRGNFWKVLVVVLAVAVVTAAVDYTLWRVAIEILPDLVGAWLAGVVSDTVGVGLAAGFLTAAYWQLARPDAAREIAEAEPEE
jgi:hypothetical protein